MKTRASAFTPIEPSDADIRAAKKASPRLAAGAAGGARRKAVIRLTEAGREEEVQLPASAVRMLGLILDEFAKGHAVALAPVERELSTQQAADLLNVSRPYLVSLLEAGKLPHRKVGTHRRLRLADVLRYKVELDETRDRALTELTRLSQELGLYD